MPNFPQRAAVVPEEMNEYPVVGPFGGIQSELPPDQLENIGFEDTTNFLFRKGAAYIRPGYTALPPFPAPVGEPVLGIYDFFETNGNRIQVVLTPTRLLQWNSLTASWAQILGPAFTGTNTQIFSADTVNQLFCFSQGTDQIFIYNGISANYLQSSVNAPAAYYLAEIGLHLMALNTTESGVRYTQRYHWSGIGDPTDWTSFSSGINDEVSNLGPGNGLLKLGQYGFGWHQWGIVQIQPTGIGSAPFYFTAMASSFVGTVCPRSLAKFNQNGVECAAYVGKDNIYIFNQSSIIPIGDQPIDGRRRLGARSKIFADLLALNPALVYGFVTQNIAGQIFNAYWLILPGVSVWVYNFDEGNWTRFTYNGMQTVAGLFFRRQAIRIMDLVGSILSQTWTPANLGAFLPFDNFAIGYNNGQIAAIDFTNYSEQAAQIISGKCLFGDRRHSKTVKKFRLVVLDNGPVTWTLTITSSTGQTQTQTVTLGTGSGDTISYVFTFNVQGLRVQWTLSVPALAPAAFVEFAPMCTINGEQRGGVQDQ